MQPKVQAMTDSSMRYTGESHIHSTFVHRALSGRHTIQHKEQQVESAIVPTSSPVEQTDDPEDPQLYYERRRRRY